MNALELFEQLGIRYYPPNKQPGRDRKLATCCDRFVGRLIEQRGLPNVCVALRCITESEGNSNALISDVIGSISDILLAHPRWPATGLRFVEAFDCINLLEIRKTAKAANVQPLRVGVATLIAIELAKVLGPSRPPKAPKAPRIKAEPKPPRSLTRIPAIEANIALGVKLLALRAQFESNREYGAQVRANFHIDAATAVDCARVAKAFATRPEIYRAASWITLIELASPKMSASVRQALEKKILAGQSVTAREIRRARGPLKGGSPKRRPADQPLRRMAA
jgi:hypothetical protein